MSNTNNDELIKNIREWVNIDTDLKGYQKLIREMRIKKKVLTENLVETMKRNNIDAFDIKDGSLIYHERKVKTGLTKKHVITQLGKLFEHEPEKIEYITNSIMDSRETKLKHDIRHKTKNLNKI